ncbi:hypothetical protein OHT52_21335 [Streptomyces sp. NBC_00247]|uniref:hypothetical protein n=1 Tax=Streptomyces sp. NBC_00247 TaxID=2975689 RepID=UPI002E2CDBC6|nr:hypothetical protein [Streptomyces sp. NBC_00247]
MNAHRVNAAAGVIGAAQQQSNAATDLAAALEAAGLLQSPETAASPWERAVAGLNALVDADVVFHVEPDGHISAPFSDEHIEWDLRARRWVLTHDTDEDPCHPCGCPKRFNRHAEGRLTEAAPADEYRFCGADLGRTEFPHTCHRRIAHEGQCKGEMDVEVTS